MLPIETLILISDSIWKLHMSCTGARRTFGKSSSMHCQTNLPTKWAWWDHQHRAQLSVLPPVFSVQTIVHKTRAFIKRPQGTPWDQDITATTICNNFSIIIFITCLNMESMVELDWCPTTTAKWLLSTYKIICDTTMMVWPPPAAPFIFLFRVCQRRTILSIFSFCIWEFCAVIIKYNFFKQLSLSTKSFKVSGTKCILHWASSHSTHYLVTKVNLHTCVCSSVAQPLRGQWSGSRWNLF